jgi:uncharacterized protein YqgV (UPF0045/DUF77 family)
MIVEIQCVPAPTGTDDAPYAHVDAAIAVLAASGLTYEVGALGTTVQGPADQVWPLLRAAHEAALDAGATSVASVIKLHQSQGDRGPTMADLVAEHR